MYGSTVLARSFGPRARTLELPLLVRSIFFFFFFWPVFAVRSPSISRRGNFGRLA